MPSIDRGPRDRHLNSMPHRSDLEAAHARIAALERELAAARGLRGARQRFRAPPPPPPPPGGFAVTDTAKRLRIEWTAGREPVLAAARAFAAVAIPVAVVLGVSRDRLVTACLGGLVFAAILALGMARRVAVEVIGDRLHLGRGIVTAAGRHWLARTEIAQLYCLMRHGEERATYELWSELVAGDRVCLVRSIATVEGAVYLERALEHRLGIIARPLESALPEAPIDS